MADLLHEHYKNYISLGSACYISLNLIRLGLRRASFPFDWLICDYRFVVDSFQSGSIPDVVFDSNHLIQNPNRPYEYFNPEYKTWFIHDYEDTLPLKIQTSYVRKKYRRRLQRLFDCLNEPTLLIRQCQTQEEVDFILDHYSEIESWLRCFNPENGIIFLLSPDQNIFCPPQDCAALPFFWCGQAEKASGNLPLAPLDANEELRQFFQKHRRKGDSFAKTKRPHPPILERILLGLIRRLYHRIYRHWLVCDPNMRP